MEDRLLQSWSRNLELRVVSWTSLLPQIVKKRRKFCITIWSKRSGRTGQFSKECWKNNVWNDPASLVTDAIHHKNLKDNLLQRLKNLLEKVGSQSKKLLEFGNTLCWKMLFDCSHYWRCSKYYMEKLMWMDQTLILFLSVWKPIKLELWETLSNGTLQSLWSVKKEFQWLDLVQQKIQFQAL